MSFGGKQAKHLSRGISLGYFLPLGKSSASLGEDWAYCK